MKTIAEWHMANGSSITFKGNPSKNDELIGMDEPIEIGHFMVEPLPEHIDGTLDDLVARSREWKLDAESAKLYRGIAQSDAFTAEAAHRAFAGVKRREPTTVMALDFHDSSKST